MAFTIQMVHDRALASSESLSEADKFLSSFMWNEYALLPYLPNVPCVQCSHASVGLLRLNKITICYLGNTSVERHVSNILMCRLDQRDNLHTFIN